MPKAMLSGESTPGNVSQGKLVWEDRPDQELFRQTHGNKEKSRTTMSLARLMSPGSYLRARPARGAHSGLVARPSPFGPTLAKPR